MAAPRTTRKRTPRLAEYRRKRDFSVTAEPAPGGATRSETLAAAGQPSFMIHKHDATRLHYDLRLEMDGALASWSVPKGPSYDPGQKRLAIQTEDHPIEYGKFEGRIPDGEYGAGDSLIWDRGTYDTVPPGQASAMRKKGHLHLRFAGEKLQGEWHLVRTGGQAPGTKSQWLMFKAKDGHEKPDYDVVAQKPASVVSGRVATRGPERKSTLRAPHARPEAIAKAFLPPMLASLAEAIPEQEERFSAELKIDGFRALCALSGGQVAMLSRNGLDLSQRFPRVAKALAKLVVGDAVIDAEVAVPDAKGVPRFELLQQGGEEVLYAFDLLRLDGEDLRKQPLERRRDLLRSLFSNAPAPLQVLEEVEGPLAEALARVARLGHEGLVLKSRGGSYQAGRSKDWLKLKALATQELAIVGWMPGRGAAAGQLGALLLGISDGKTLQFAGKVGTGFSAKQRKELLALLRPDEVPAPVGKGAPRLRGAHWVTPKLVAQVRFTEWTSDGKLRHPAFQGLRDDKSPLQCTREAPRSAKALEQAVQAQSGTEEGARPRGRSPSPAVALTNPDRVLYPDCGVTKRDLAAYYEALAQPLLSALADRPLALVHWNQGITKPSWFQQNIGDEAEPWMRLTGTHTRTSARVVRHLIADRPEALRWLAQHSVLELHAWHSREPSLTMPDWVVFDLDPAEGAGIEQAIEVALLLKGMLDRLGLPSLPKTTGKRGLHVLLPLLPGHTYDDAQDFALQVGQTVAKAVPSVTLERSKAKRKGRLYFDCLQNAYGKTVIAPYSPRGLPGAPVSTPLRWSEVVPGLDPARFNLKTLPKRVARLGDLFAPALRDGVRLPRFR